MIDSQTREALRILQTPPQHRTQTNLEMLHRATSHLTFFKELSRKFRTDKVTKDLCRHLELCKLKSQQTLSMIAEISQSVFIVLDGKLTKRVGSKQRNSDSEDSEGGWSTLTQGDYFGRVFEKRGVEIEVEAEVPSTLMRMLNDKYIEIMSEFESSRQAGLMAFVSSIPTFNYWTKSSIAKLIATFDVRTYFRNQVVYQEGDKATEVYLIQQGEFKFVKQVRTQAPWAPDLTDLYGPRKSVKDFCYLRRVLHRPDNSKARKVEIAILGPKELFGEGEVLNDKPRQSSCVCISATSELIAISRADFFRRMTHSVTLETLRGKNRCQQTFHNKRLDAFLAHESDIKALSDIKAQPNIASSRPKSSRSASSSQFLTTCLSTKDLRSSGEKSLTKVNRPLLSTYTITCDTIPRPKSGHLVVNSAREKPACQKKGVLVPRLGRHTRKLSC